jgi:hypothetical protein
MGLSFFLERHCRKTKWEVERDESRHNISKLRLRAERRMGPEAVLAVGLWIPLTTSFLVTTFVTAATVCHIHGVRRS